MALFAVEDLSFRYPGAARDALSHVTLEVRAGELLTLCGQSGCGKTTLLRHLKPVLAPHGVRSGRVLLDGVPMDEVPEREQAARIGFVMQNPDAQVVTDKVWHELAFGLENLGCDERTMRVRVAEMASYFGIQNWFRKDVRDLSGGQRQLLNLASVMALQPDVLILDEPTSQLDPIAASDFLATVRKINRELGTTVIITEHRLEDVYASSDAVAVMEGGRLAMAGTPREVGERLRAEGSALVGALPAPLRICYCVRDARAGGCPGGGPSGDAAGAGAEDASVVSAEGRDAWDADDPAGPAPLTVREGRAWLAGEVAAHPPVVRALPDGAELDEDGRPAAAELEGVWFRYDRDAPDVLRGTTLHVPEGSLFAVVGGNGTGKSTMLRVLCGTLRPYRGTVRVLGKPLGAWRRGELFRGGVAMLPQDPQNLMVKKTVRADLEEMLDDRGLSAAQREAAVAQAAATADVGALLDAHPLDLSGGELQRAALAKVLLCEPRLLLLDEPTKGLDAAFKAKLARVLRDLAASGVTVLMVSHDVEFCAAHADAVALFFDGGVAAANTPRRFFASNSFYTTAANRMSRGVFANAVTDEDVIALCTQK